MHGGEAQGQKWRVAARNERCDGIFHCFQGSSAAMMSASAGQGGWAKRARPGCADADAHPSSGIQSNGSASFGKSSAARFRLAIQAPKLAVSPMHGSAIRFWGQRNRRPKVLCYGFLAVDRIHLISKLDNHPCNFHVKHSRESSGARRPRRHLACCRLALARRHLVDRNHQQRKCQSQETRANGAQKSGSKAAASIHSNKAAFINSSQPSARIWKQDRLGNSVRQWWGLARTSAAVDLVWLHNHWRVQGSPHQGPPLRQCWQGVPDPRPIHALF
jgi:hypothetical protein